MSDHVQVGPSSALKATGQADSKQSPELSQACHGCNKRLDWNFITEFYNRERHLVDQVHQLNHQVASCSAALQHAGVSAQNDRKALNSVNAQLVDLQGSYAQLQVRLARVDNKSHEEGQEVHELQNTLNQNRHRILELEQNLDCVWKAHARMGEIVSDCAAQDGRAPSTVDVGHLLLELESKTLRIQHLEEEREAYLRDLSNEREAYLLSLQQHQSRLLQLQSLVPAGTQQEPLYVAHAEKATGRKRRRCRGRARTSNTAPPMESQVYEG
ncbi:MAG: hypothetical protein LQ337_006517 [Flavoplaca oasis]|nr:MAG: hypothetical protein LQ337_006517 [Flavoplaca oasis]